MKKFGFLIMLLFLTTSASLTFAADSADVKKDHNSINFHEQMMELMNKNHTMMHDMAATGNIDSDFAKMMIVHHQGAIDMAQSYLEKGSDPALKGMAKKMVAEQKKEIEKLQKHSK